MILPDFEEVIADAEAALGTSSPCVIQNGMHFEYAADIQGMTVSAIREAYRSSYGISDRAKPFVNGEEVSEAHVLNAGESIEFIRQSGSKGLGRLYTKDELAEFWNISVDAVATLLSGSGISPLTLDGKELYSELVVDRLFASEEVPAAESLEPLAISNENAIVPDDRIHSLESKLEKLIEAVNLNKFEKDLQIEKEWYTTGEVAELLKRKPNSIMQACADGRIQAEKDEYSLKWKISRTEVAHLLELRRIPSKKINHP